MRTEPTTIGLRGFEAAWIVAAIEAMAQRTSPPPGVLTFAVVLNANQRQRATVPDVELVVAPAGWFARPMTYTEAATAAGVSRRTVQRLVTDGHLRTVRVGARPRIPRCEIDRYRQGRPR